MKKGALLINTGRGQLLDEAAVAAALKSGRLGGFGADVLSSEPPAADNPLLGAPNSFITPHIAWATREARERLYAIAVANIRAFLDGTPKNLVS
jgi:glycerate dehydrogenase